MKRALLTVTMLWAIGCGGSEEPVDALVVVQETNLLACEKAYSYDREVQRTCDDRGVAVEVCSDHELCDAQLTALTATIAACDNAEDVFMAETTQGCD